MKLHFTFFIGLILLCLNSTIHFSQWQLKNNGIPNFISGGPIDAVDENIALFTSVNYLFTTTNAGTDWTQKILPEPYVTDIAIINSDHIWIGTDTGKIYCTSDGGTSWILQYDNENETKFINYIEMFTPNLGVAMGDGLSITDQPTSILKTENGGATWQSVSNSILGWSGDVWRRIDFVNTSVGYFCATGINSQKLYKTIDGGFHWAETSHPPFCAMVIKFYNENIGIVGDVSTIYKTSDGGLTWSIFDTILEGWLSDFEFLPNNPQHLWAATTHSLYFSNDGGETWTKQFLIDGDLKASDIVFVDNTHGWLRCSDGQIYFTDNNGGIVTNVDDDGSQVPPVFQLMQNYPNPFNPATNISFSIPERIHVSLKIFNITGQEISTLVDNELSAGTHNVKFTAKNLSSGIYLYKLQAGKFTETKKLVLMK